MQNDVNQKISMFLDDELDYDDSQALLKRIRTDESLKAVMLRYQAVSHAMKTEEYQKLSPNFFEQISQQVRQEATYLLPERKPITSARNKKLIALAASTLVAAVLVGQNIRNQRSFTLSQNLSANSSTNTLNSNTSEQPVLLAQKSKNKPSDRQPMTKEFNDYLQAHNGSVYMNGGLGTQSYAKVAAYGQE